MAGLVSLQSLIEGAKKRRTAYRSGRRELIGIDQFIREAVPKMRRPLKRRERSGRLIKRTVFASRQRWRVY